MAEAGARLERATALATAGRLDEALAICAAAAAAEPGLRRLAGQILQAQGRDAEAAAAYQRIVADDPGDWEIWNNLGNTRLAAGDPAGAVAALRRAAAIRPDVLPIQANLGGALARAGDPEAALDAYRKALDLGPGIAL